VVPRNRGWDHQQWGDGCSRLSLFPWAALRYQHTQALYARLLEQYSPATANKIMASACRVLEEAWKLGQMGAEDYHRVIALERKSNQRLPHGRALSAGELQALMSVYCQDELLKGCRDAALIREVGLAPEE
jgi:hypothetical protein